MSKQTTILAECECRRKQTRKWTVQYCEIRSYTNVTVWFKARCSECDQITSYCLQMDDFLDCINRFSNRVTTLEARYHDEDAILEHFYE